MRSERELQLYERFMSVKPICIAGKSVLTTYLRKLARPIGQYD